MFNLEDYETVEERLVKFWKEHPDGRIETALVESTLQRFIIKAAIYRTEVDAQAWTTGFAEETVSTRGVNSTSALENCETSAIGRALANYIYSKKGARPSRTEMQRVANTGTGAVFAVENKLEDPVQWGSAEFKAPVAPKPPAICCDKGHILRTGITKATNKPYYGYVCAGQIKEHAAWAKQDATGSWFFPSEKGVE
jgi:hypothetical protein